MFGKRKQKDIFSVRYYKHGALGRKEIEHIQAEILFRFNGLIALKPENGKDIVISERDFIDGVKIN